MRNQSGENTFASDNNFPFGALSAKYTTENIFADWLRTYVFRTINKAQIPAANMHLQRVHYQREIIPSVINGLLFSVK